METKKELKFSEKLAWAVGKSTGTQFVSALIATYILVFLTDVFGVAAGAAGVIMTLATIWDAINDPILGSIADKTRTKWGTYRPFLLFVPVPLAIVVTLLFAAPELSPTGKIAYAAILYVCYGMLFTCIEIPYNALLPAMTRNEMERNDTISLSTFIASIVILIVSSFTPNLVGALGGEDTAKGYMLLALIGAVCMVITSWYAFATCKERYTVSENQSHETAKALKALFKVKEMYPMLLFWCVGCILFNIIMASSVYYCMYYLMNPGLIATYMLVISVSGMVGVIVFMPVIIRLMKGSIKKTVVVTQVIAAASYLVCFFVGGKSIPMLYVFTAIGCIFSTMTNAYRPMTVVGMTDLVLGETGNQLNGTISAIGGFSYKCGTALSNGILAGMLAATGYVAGAIGGQTDAFMLGINSVRFLVPFIATVLYIILIQFYPEHKIMQNHK